MAQRGNPRARGSVPPERVQASTSRGRVGPWPTSVALPDAGKNAFQPSKNARCAVQQLLIPVVDLCSDGHPNYLASSATVRLAPCLRRGKLLVAAGATFALNPGCDSSVGPLRFGVQLRIDSFLCSQMEQSEKASGAGWPIELGCIILTIYC